MGEGRRIRIVTSMTQNGKSENTLDNRRKKRKSTGRGTNVKPS